MRGKARSRKSAVSCQGQTPLHQTGLVFVRRKQIQEIAKSQPFMNEPPLREIFRSEVLGDKRKRDKSIGEEVFEHGYTQREVADHLRFHFTSVSRILRAKDKMPRK